MTYQEKLKDPRWQKKRLEIMERDEFRCQYCGDDESTLNVHHYYYEKNKEPWDYNNDDLTTLCEDCHDSESNHRKEYEALLLETLKKKKICYDTIREIAYIFNETSYDFNFDPCLSAFKWWMFNNENLNFMYNKYFEYLEHEREKRENGKNENGEKSIRRH